MTYIEEIEAALAEAKKHLIRAFGDQSDIHNALSDLRSKVLNASSRVTPPDEGEDTKEEDSSEV